MLASSLAHAAGACSPDVGRVVLNEYAHQLNFAEIKRLNVNTDITNWKIRIYRSASPTDFAQRSLPSLADPSCTPPYIYQTAMFGSNETPFDADVVLLDANDDVVDIIQARRNLPPSLFYTPVPACGFISPPIYVQVDAARKGVDRMPDGAGPWRNTPGTGAGSYTTECRGNTPSGPAADLFVTKTASSAAIPTGGQVTFTVTLKNNGPNTANTIIVSDQLPAGLTYVSHNVTAGSYDPVSGVWAISTLASGASRVLTLVASGSTAGTYTNTAQASSDNTDSNSANNMASATVTVGYADLSITKVVDNASVTAGNNVTFTLTATNHGPTTANSVVVSDLLPAGLTYQSHSATSGTFTAGTGVWAIGILANGASATLAIVAQANATAINTASVSSSNNVDTVAGNNSASVTVTVTSGIAGFECIETGITYNNLTPLSSTRNPIYTKLTATDFKFDVVALQLNGEKAASYTAAGNVTVELFDDSATPAPVCSAYSGPVASQSITFAVGDAGRKTLSGSFNLPNAYRKLRCRVKDANLMPTVYGCSSDQFSVRPLEVAVSSNATADATGTSASATPAFKAGAAFTLAATAVLGYNGMPVLDAGKAAAHSGAVQTGTLAGGFPNADPATGMATGVAFTYSEVGYFNLASNGVYDDTFTSVDSAMGDCTNDFSNTAVGGKYGCKFGNAATTSYFGRFIPHHFDVAVTEGCSAGGFTYSGQPMVVQVTARNSGGGVTQNYSPVFSKIVTLSEVNGISGSLSPTSVGTNAFSAGVASAVPAFTFATKTTPPAIIKLRAVDTDNVSSETGAEGTANIRSGRARISNAYGSELFDLPMSFRTQYWNGTGWMLNSADVCTGDTTLGAANAVSLTLSSGLTCVWDALPAPGLSNAGCATAAPAGRNFLEGATPSVGFAGNFNLWLKKPGSAGTVTVTPSVPAWLGAVPPARATFGIYKTPIIYMRENY